jgi:flagellar biosynthesis/type III secretory pathway chaperone
MNAASASPVATPSALVELEIAGYKALLRLLDAERDALLRLDADAIEAAAAAKQAQVQSLEQLARARKASLAASGLPETAEGVAVWMASSGDAASAAHAWATLLDLARAARTANARNGRVIVRQRGHYDAAIAALLQAAGVPAVYGADGRPQAAMSGRTLAAI